LNGLKRIFKASKSTALLLVVVETYLGLALVLELGILSGLVDALIGAQAIEVVTSDVTKYLWQQIGLFISLLPALAIQQQFEGLVAKLGVRIRQAAFIASAAVIALPISIIFVPTIIVFSFVERYVRNIFATLSYSALVLLIASLLSKTIVISAVYGQTAVGEVLYWGGALLALSGYLALKPYIPNSKF
jgi:hypothetical protein